jgi:hypothetical protein
VKRGLALLAVGAVALLVAGTEVTSPLFGVQVWDRSGGLEQSAGQPVSWSRTDGNDAEGAVEGKFGDPRELARFIENLPGTAPASMDLEDALSLASALPAERIPLPSTPEGPAPLASALEGYLQAIGVPSPGLPALAAAGSGLHINQGAEAALARLVVAYTRTLALQEEALANLDESERLDLAGLHGEAAAMRAADLVDKEPMWQAADLLVRAAEDARPALESITRTPTSIQEAVTNVDSELAVDVDPWLALESVLDAAGDPSTSWSSPPSPNLTLAAAVESLAAALGVDPSGLTGLPSGTTLPPSLDHAIATIVQAHADGIQQGDGVHHAAGVTRAVRDATPTLKAWGALLAPSPTSQVEATEVLGAAFAGRPDALAAAALGTTLSRPVQVPALAPLLRDYGLGVTESVNAAASIPPQAAAALALVLQAERANREAHANVRALLTDEQANLVAATPQISLLLAQPRWDGRQAAVVEAWAGALAALRPALPALDQAQAASVAATQAAAAALSTLPQLPTVGVPGAAPEMQATAAARSPPDPLCPVQSPLSNCAHDIFLEISEGQGILVTGRGSTTIDGRFAGGDAHIVIDLGGNDVHKVSSGAATAGLGIPSRLVTDLGLHETSEGEDFFPFADVYVPGWQDSSTGVDNVVNLRAFAVTLDAGGDDEYTTARPIAQGAASGFGTVGILWDRSGNDHYTQIVNPGPQLQAGQGVGLFGGFGMLIDEAGADDYRALNSLAQGIGWSPPLAMSAGLCGSNGGDVCLFGAGPPNSNEGLAGTGILVDNGDGADAFTARQGQGHSTGAASVGILIDAAGATAYSVVEADSMFQGGRGMATRPGVVPLVAVEPPTASGGLALLIDLGGDGDSYTSPDFGPYDDPETGGILSIRPPGRDSRKDDDAAWSDMRHAVAFGLDSSLGDTDSDGFSDLAELLYGTDPDDVNDKPDQPDPLVNQVGHLLGELEPMAKDTDRDRFPDAVEGAWGSDPEDPASMPIRQPDGFLLSMGSLCVSDAPPECTEEGACDPVRFRCMRLLEVGDTTSTIHNRSAIISIDLGGNDHYPAPVAGDGAIRHPSAGSVRKGSLSLDVSGDDSYGDATAEATQAYNAGGASLLFDLSGDDTYIAGANAQAAVQGEGVAILADLQGNDLYSVTGVGQAAFTAGATSTNRSMALLFDAVGDDRYAASTQATVSGAPRDALAALVDLSGDDRYLANALPSDLAGGDGATATPFEAHGRLVRNPGDIGASTLTWGAFVDAGGRDQYRGRTEDGAIADRSSKLDGAGLVRNAPRGPAGPSAGDTGTAGASFADGTEAVMQDSDGDGFVWLAEVLLGSDPDSEASSPARNDPAGDAVRVEPTAALAGTGGGNLRLPGLLISGTEGRVHNDYVSFLVDLGGNDHYRAPNVGGASAALHHVQGVNNAMPALRLAPAFLLDVSGDDDYEPEPCNETLVTSASVRALDAADATTEPDGLEGTYIVGGERHVPYCPSLGGAVGGVAVLVDGGGSNRFTSSMRINVTTVAAPGINPAAEVRGWGVTQGASLFHGAGILVTHGTVNQFAANVTVLTRESGESEPTPEADAITLAQGAAWGHGFGALFSAELGQDTYLAKAWAEAPRNGGADAGRAWAFAQGAARSGVGILVDTGGKNLFQANAGVAQGAVYHAPWSIPATTVQSVSTDSHHGHLPFALLASGTGDDTYEGGPASQGAAANIDSTQDLARAMLVDAGGDDLYRVTNDVPIGIQFPPGASACEDVAPWLCALAQGAAAGMATATLVDWAGNDRYDAVDLQIAQGAGLREGLGTLLDMGGQDTYLAGAFAQGATGGTLVDASGHDRYWLAAGDQGAGRFIDAGGRDSYMDAGTKMAWPQGAASEDGNDWTWTTGALTPPGIGVDHEGLEGSLVLAFEMSQAPAPIEVTVQPSRNPAGDDPIAPGERAAETVYIFAQVDSTMPLDAIRRVDILRDGQLMGTATRVGTTSGYSLPWDTRTGPDSVPDGTYAFQAVAMVAPNPGQPGAGAVDGTPVASAEESVDVDNAPSGTAMLSGAQMSPAVAASWPTLTVDVATELGGGPLDLKVDMVGADGSAEALHQAVPSGTASTVVLDGTCDGAPCADGDYLVNVTISDGSRSTTVASLPLLIDSTPPSGTLMMPGVAGPTYRGIGNSVGVVWSGSDEGSGLARAVVKAYRPDGTLLATASSGPAGEPVAIAPVSNGDRVVLTLRLEDAAGNVFDPCAGPNPHTCPSALAVLIDFVAPQASGLHITPTLVGPRREVHLSVDAQDEHSHIEAVQASLHGARELAPFNLALTTAPTYAATVELPAGPPIEAPFTVDAVAKDAAGTTVQAATATGVLDTMMPRFSGPAILYDGAASGVGKPGGSVVIGIDVTDHLLSAVTVAAPTLGVGDGTPCTANGPPVDHVSTWQCALAIPAATSDGQHTLTIAAQDAAGNAENMTSVLVEVDATPAVPQNVRVRTGPDFLEISWETSRPASGHVDYGRSQLRDKVNDPEVSDSHVVRLSGLQPRTTYRYQVTTVTPANVATSSLVLTANTTSGYELTIDVGPDNQWSGQRFVEVTLTNLVTGTAAGPVAATLRLQDASSPATLTASTQNLVPGVNRLALDTTAFPDGVYVLVIDALRGSDNRSTASPPVRLDNLEPILQPISPRDGAFVGNATPVLEVYVIDPSRPDLPALSGLRVRIDGNEVAANATLQTKDGISKLVIQSEHELSTGPHVVGVNLTDGAGNIGWTTWSFTVDRDAPLLESVAAARPGGIPARPGVDLPVRVVLSDLAGVASAAIDLRGAGGSLTPLLQENGSWHATVRIPHTASNGPLRMPLIVADVVGNSAARHVVVEIDAVAPRFATVVATAIDPVRANIDVTTDSPSFLTASWRGGTLPMPDAPSMTHSFVVDGLRPGSFADIHLNATDPAGNHAIQIVEVTTPRDEVPPSALSGLRASSTVEGEVLLAWEMATDDFGLDGYEILRTQDGKSVLLDASANATEFRDLAAPGRLARYEVRAIDLGGLAGAPAFVDAQVLALPHLSGARIVPESGRADEPFYITVDYWHPAGLRPDVLELRMAGHAVPLAPLDDRQDCATRCAYATDAILPATSTIGRLEVAQIVVIAAGETASLPVDLPLVTAGGQDIGVHAGSRQDTPASAWSVLVLLLFVLALRRRPIQ